MLTNPQSGDLMKSNHRLDAEWLLGITKQREARKLERNKVFSSMFTAHIEDGLDSDQAVLFENTPDPTGNEHLLRVRKAGARGKIKNKVMPPSIRALESLKSDMPNFSAVIDYVMEQAALRALGDQMMGFSPILIVSDPGVGKTVFAECLSEIIGTEYHPVDMSTVTAAFVLTGSSPQWNGATPGIVFDSLFEGRYINPVMLLDEAEKATEGQYPPINALYRLLEKEQARRFRDECLGMEIDASHIMWILTGNGLGDLHPAILSRVKVFEVEKPTYEESLKIANSVWQRLRAKEACAEMFDAELSDEVIEILVEMSPRVMKQALQSAMGKAALMLAREERNQAYLRPEDIVVTENKKRKIGFV